MAFGGLTSWFKKRIEDVRDVFDANTAADQQRRVSAGQPRMYQAQQAQIRQAAPPADTRSLFSKVFDQGNPIDGGRSFKTPTPMFNPKPVTDFGQPKYGVLADPTRLSQFKQAQARELNQPLRPLKEGLSTFGGALKETAVGVGKPVVRTGAAFIDIPKYGAALMSHDKSRIEANRQNTIRDLSESLPGLGARGIVQGIASLPTPGAMERVIKPRLSFDKDNVVEKLLGGPVPTVQKQYRMDRAAGKSPVEAGGGAIVNIAGDALSIFGAAKLAGQVSRPTLEAGSRAVKNLKPLGEEGFFNPFSTAETSQLRSTVKQMQRQWDKLPAGSPQRKVLNQQIAKLNQEVRKVEQGGYAKLPGKGSFDDLIKRSDESLKKITSGRSRQPEPSAGMHSNAMDRVFRTNPNSPVNSQRLRGLESVDQQPVPPRVPQLPPLPKVEPIRISSPPDGNIIQDRLVKTLGREPSYSQRVAIDRYKETGSRAEALEAYKNEYISRGALYGGERRAEVNVNRVLDAVDQAEGAQPIKVISRSGAKQIGVNRLTEQGDSIISTNLKSGKEKRFALDDNGELMPDTNGAYRLFTDNDGRVRQFRIGDKVYHAEDLGDLADVNDYGSSLATMRRNIERGFGKGTNEKVNRFLVDHQQAQATKMIERQVALRDNLQKVADDLGINFAGNSRKAKRVSSAIQEFGEGNMTKEQLVSKFGDEMAEKIVNADKWFRQQYDTLLDEANKTLAEYGYDPIPKRKNYYTHFQEPSVWESFGLRMKEIHDLASPTLQDAMPNKVRGKISNKLAGESEFTQPNKRFNPYALRREGEGHVSDAFQSFERYLSPTLNNIYMTPSISRARVLAKAVAQDADMVGKDANKIIIQLKEYANNLAGKSNRADRVAADLKGGQQYLRVAQWAQKKAGQNTIIGNASTAVMQPVVLAQTAGKFGYKNTLLAFMQEMSTAHGKNAPIRQSKFMTRRYSDLSPVTAGKMDRAKELANGPLEIVEETSARVTWNAAHNDALSKGLKGEEAIRYADAGAEKTLAGRSLGEKPELFRSRAAGPFTMYQLEVNNFWQQFGKEMTKTQAAKTMAAAYGFNLLLQQATGRQVGFNPIDAVIDSYGEIGKDKSGMDKGKAIAQRLAGEIVDNTPFIAPVANAAIGDKKLRNFLGESSNTGRFGVSSPLSALLSTTNVGGIPIPQNLVLPFGGSQAKKTFEGIQAMLKGRVDDKNGDALVNVPQNPISATRGTLFGKNSIPEVGAYYDNLGRKEVDQKAVPNQTNSKAASMANGKSIIRITNSTEKNEKGKYTSRDKYDAVIHAMSKDGDNGVHINDYDNAELRKAVKDIGSEMNGFLKRSGLPKVDNDTRTAKIWADYVKSQEDGSISKIGTSEAQKGVIREVYKTKLPKNVNEFLSLQSDDSMRQALQKGLISKKELQKAVEFDDFLVEKGLSSYAMIGKALRSELGFGYPGKGGSGGKGSKKAMPSISLAFAPNKTGSVKITNAKAPSATLKVVAAKRGSGKKAAIKIAKQSKTIKKS